MKHVRPYISQIKNLDSRLPVRPSDLILLALSDLEKCENDPRYKICMSCWHIPSYKEESMECLVCLAGAVMAKTLNAPINKPITPNTSYEKYKTIADKLFFLSFISTGLTDSAMKLLRTLSKDTKNYPIKVKGLSSAKTAIREARKDFFVSGISYLEPQSNRISEEFRNFLLTAAQILRSHEVSPRKVPKK